MALKPQDPRAFKKAFWKSFSTLTGTFLGAGAGSLLHRIAGDGIKGIGFAVGMAFIGLVLVFWGEYNRER